jgi:hypothetical protein
LSDASVVILIAFPRPLYLATRGTRCHLSSIRSRGNVNTLHFKWRLIALVSHSSQPVRNGQVASILDALVQRLVHLTNVLSNIPVVGKVWRVSYWLFTTNSYQSVCQIRQSWERGLGIRLRGPSGMKFYLNRASSTYSDVSAVPPTPRPVAVFCQEFQRRIPSMSSVSGGQFFCNALCVTFHRILPSLFLTLINADGLLYTSWDSHTRNSLKPIDLTTRFDSLKTTSSLSYRNKF